MIYLNRLIRGVRQNPPDTPRYQKAKDEITFLLVLIGILATGTDALVHLLK